VHAVELSDVAARYPARAGRAAGPERLRVERFQLHEGELCALLGPNGSGKSTLLRVIAGVIAPHRGSVQLLGEAKLDRQERARRVAVVPQRCEVALGFSVRDVVAMGRAPHQDVLLRETRADRAAVDRAIEACDLAALAARPVAELSGGEQKRVHIARALAQEAPVLLLDEATADLDVRHAIALYELVRAEVQARGLACLAAMHDLNAAAHYADRVVLLDDGAVVADGPVPEVMTAERLGRVFGTAIEVAELADGRRCFLGRGRPAEMST
jgi:iron complex transport system ATP-binding protein